MHVPAHGRAGGKVILLGEHVVVYGRPALATGLPLATLATVVAGHGPRLVSDEAPDPRGIRLVADAARAMDLDPSRAVVHVRSEIPPGRGLGSSAALSVAVLRAMAAAAGRPLDDVATCARGRELEGIFHGTPSGVDPAAAALGTCFRFVRGEPPAIAPLAVAPGLRLVVAYGDRPRSTATAVGGVRERWQADPQRYERLFDEVAVVVDGAVDVLAAGDVAGLGAAFDQNQALLAALGVSSPETDALVARAKASGAAGAKLTGGGAGGAVIAVARDTDALARAMAVDGITTFVLDVTGTPEGTRRAAAAR